MKNSIISIILVFSLIFISCGGSEGNVCESCGIYGVVTDKAKGDPIKNAGVELLPVGLKTVTGSDGSFGFDISEGKYNLLVAKPGYIENKSSAITVKSGQQVPHNVPLEKAPAALQILKDGKEISELDFGAEIADVSRQFDIFNNGEEKLNWQISYSADWIKEVRPDAGELKAFGTQGVIVIIDRSLLESGKQTITIHVTSDSGNKQLKIKVMTSSRIRECTDLPENAEWNNYDKIKQTWDGKEWIPPTTGSYNEISNDMECRFKCKKKLYMGKLEMYFIETVSCENLPNGASWTTPESVEQTWNGSEWVPSNQGVYDNGENSDVCKFQCNTNYTWNGSKCVANTQTANCAGLPENASWNTASSITQTWNGSSWQPSPTGTYNTTASTTECRYKCNTNYNWSSSTSKCIAATQQENCSPKPANSVWNDNGKNGKFTQTWSGTEWSPASYASSYNTTAGICVFKCNINYNWNSSTSTCDAAKQTVNCSPKPANTVWNTVSTVTQTWSGSAWSPSNTSIYNTTPSTSECRYKCANGSHAENNGASCISNTKTGVACTGLPANASWNTASSITQTWNGSSWQPTSIGSYNTVSSNNECRYKCNTNYTWTNSTCKADSKVSNCTGLPSNASWNTVSTISQTWNGTEWIPTTVGTYNTTASSTECRYKCANGSHAENNGASCISNTKTGVACTGLPANASWNTASSITQTWNGSSWQPSPTGTYNTTVSTTECRYKCNTNYTWTNSTCKADSKVSNCTGLPSNASWNTVSTISQTWNGTEWIPTTVGTYNTTASTKECRFQCNSGYRWNNSQCELALPACFSTTPCQDRSNGLFWSSKSSNAISYSGALSYCNNITEGNFNDWRLPTIDELRTLIQNCSSPASVGTCGLTDPYCLSASCHSNCSTCTKNDTGFYSKFKDTGYFWSSSRQSDSTSNYVWLISFSTGALSTGSSGNYYVRCVRN